MIKDVEYLIKKIFLSETFLLKKRLKRSIKKNYEKELEITKLFSNKSKFAVDVGVYRGVYSYKLSKEFKHVYSFEPNPVLFSYLDKNLTKIVKNMTIYNYALSDENKNVLLKVPKRNKSLFKENYEEIYKLGCATIHKKNNFKYFDEFKVKSKLLDDILKNSDIGFIKIDVEGHEIEVIRGSENILKKRKPVLLIEIEKRHSGRSVIDTIQYINNFGYNSFYYNNKKLEKTENLKDQNSENNYIFTPI